MRLLTYNIHKGIGGRDRRYDLARTMAVIEAENPDIVCLQEVDRKSQRSKLDDQPSLFAEYFHAAASLFQPNVHGRTGAYGNLIFSRWPFIAKHQISLRMNSKKPRGAQLVVIDTPEGPLHMVNCHLGLSERERHWQIGRLLAHHLFTESLYLPTIVAGDFNDWRNTLHRADLLASEFQQVTSPISKFRSFPAYLPLGSLDKAFIRGPIAVRGARVVSSQLSRRASDHLPLVVDFHLQDGGAHL